MSRRPPDPLAGAAEAAGFCPGGGSVRSLWERPWPLPLHLPGCHCFAGDRQGKSSPLKPGLEPVEGALAKAGWPLLRARWRSEEHTSELQSLMRISYAVFCLKKKKMHKRKSTIHEHHDYLTDDVQ